MDNGSFTERLGAGSGLDKSTTKRLIETLGRVMTDCACNMDSLSIPRFGTFDPVKEDERVDIDLSTGRRVLLPPSITLKFTPGGALRNAVKKGGVK